MKDSIFKAIVALVAFVCITVAALQFHNANILWWYMVAAFIALD